MPIYEYRCRACGAAFSDLVRLGTPPEEVRCRHCGEHQSERLFSSFATSSGSTSGSSTSSSSSCAPSGGFT